MNFYGMLNFFPVLFHDVFPPDPVQVGLKGLAPGLSASSPAPLDHHVANHVANLDRQHLAQSL